MKRALPLCLAIAAAGSAATALADDETAKPSNCVFPRMIDGWAVIDDRTLVVETAAKKRYKIVFNGSCSDLKDARVVHFKPKAGSQACLAPGDSVVYSHSAFPSPAPNSQGSCTIKTVDAVVLPPEPAKDAPPP